MEGNVESKVGRLAGLMIIVLALLLVVQPTRAQSPEEPKPVSDPQQQQKELQQLKERLQQLEKAMLELKGQITAAEESKATPVPASYNLPGTPVNNNTPPLLPRLNEPSGTAIGTTKANARQEKTGESTFTVYGFAMLDVGYQWNQNDPLWFDTLRPTKLPSFEDQFAPDGKTFFGVRQSRLGVKSSIPTSAGELKTTFEFELFGTGVDAGQTTFRLRHAYGELGQFGAGQYWTIFGDTDVYPNTIEYWGPNGLVWFRNVQFRWMPLKGNNAVTIGLERPGASGDDGRFADRVELDGIRAKFDLPDLAGHVKFTRGWGTFQVAGLVRRIKWVDTIADEFDLEGSDVGWGVSLSNSLKFNKDNIGRFQITYGEGIANYLNDAPVDVAVRRNDNDDGVIFDPRRPIKGTAIPALGLSAFLDHTWSSRFTSSFGYSMVNLENSDGQAPAAYHRGHYSVGNLLFSPVENAMVGAEFQWGRRENFQDGFTSDDYRLQISFKYTFSKGFTF